MLDDILRKIKGIQQNNDRHKKTIKSIRLPRNTFVSKNFQQPNIAVERPINL